MNKFGQLLCVWAAATYLSGKIIDLGVDIVQTHVIKRRLQKIIDKFDVIIETEEVES